MIRAPGVVSCPRCKGPIRFVGVGAVTPYSIDVAATDGVRSMRINIELNQMDMHRRARCFLDPGDGEPIVMLEAS